MNHPKLSIHNLSKTFFLQNHFLEALQSINIYVNSGEFVSVIGPSGCGKTTLFNIIAGLEQSTSGSIMLDGKENKKRVGQLGYMLQKPLLLPWKTVEENVMLGLLIKHIPKEEAKRKAHELLERFHLLEFASHYPAILSGGMAQRVALLRTILYTNSFLLMDEPFGALDALTRLSMQQWLLEIWTELQSSVLFITHDIREAIFLSDRIYILSHRPGKIVKEIKVHLPRPRQRELLRTSKAVQLEQELEKILLGEI